MDLNELVTVSEMLTEGDLGTILDQICLTFKNVNSTILV